MTVKQALIQWAQQLPDDVEAEEIGYELLVSRKIEEGLRAISEDTLSWDEAERLFQSEVDRPLH